MLEEQVARALASRGWTLATAESCTGGLVAARLTALPGSSVYFLGSVVAYSNASKQRVLDVPADVLETAGGVSAEAAAAMASGVQRLFGSDLGIAITGIAGPGGGAPAKPIGLVYLALASSSRVLRAQAFCWQGDRTQNRRQSADAALQLVLEELLD